MIQFMNFNSGYASGGQGVVGSNPATPTKFPRKFNAFSVRDLLLPCTEAERNGTHKRASEQKVPKKSRNHGTLLGRPDTLPHQEGA